MAERFTEEQSKAITTLDKSVLVSAAAGSGKTSVLVERIIRIILEGKADVDEMLVVTFTKAAAAEMRSRLSSAIRKRMADHPEDAPRMKEQLAKLYKAYISTIDSFALRVIKEFFHKTDLEPSFGVADDIRCDLMKKEAVAELFEDGFANDDLIEGGSFRSFLRLYGEERSDESFMQDLTSAYDALRTMPDYFEWAYAKAEQLKITADTFEGSDLQKLMLADALETFRNVAGAFRDIRGMFDDAGLSGMYEEKLLPQEEAVFAVKETLESGRLDGSVIDAIKSIPSVTLRAKKDQKESYETIKADVKKIREAFKKDLDGLKNKYFVPDLESVLAEMNATYDYTVYYIRMLEEFGRRYDEKKRDKRVIDYSDMEHIAAGILKSDEAAESLRKRFRFIFVDEYQDTNNIQESLISRIARPDNVFRVGDVKQSIYRFRQAEPAIFERLYEKYSGGGDPDGTAIELGRNFRSNDAIIKYINRVFENIMEGYDERARLHTGVSCPPEYDFMPEVHLLFDDSEEESYDDDDDSDDSDDIAAETIEELSKEEAEAEYIAKLVASVIGTEFYDTKAGVVRKASAKDVVILFRAVKYRGEIMSRALRDHAIEPHIEESEDYFDTIETGVALALLTCIDNMKRDVPLITVLHSEIFGFTPAELARIRTGYMEHGKGGPYYRAFSWYASEGPDGDLKEKARAAKEKLLEWRELARMMPLEDMVWKVLVDSGYYAMAGAMPGGSRRQANLRTLADKAAAFSSEGISSLSSFITFIELMKSKKISNGQVPMAGSDDDVVRIATIHKSKGLEYPFVIVGGLGHKYRFDNNSKSFSFDSEVGVGLPYIDPSRRYWRSTAIQRAINSKSKRDVYSEELRLLYVAMTRARSRLYLVGTFKGWDKLEGYIPRPKNPIEAMRNVLKTECNGFFETPLELTRIADEHDRKADLYAKIREPLSAEEQKLYDELDRRFRYRYPDEELLTSKAKYSVSAVRREENEKAEEEASASKTDAEVVMLWDNNEKRKKASAADIGIAYHRIMEFLDFTRATDASGAVDEEYIASRAEFLREHNAIEEDVYSSLDLSRIAAFFRSELGRRAVAAAERGTLRREKPFTLRTTRGGREMLVQGVIDCCFEENGSMILIDYKSSFIKPGKQRDAEIERIRNEYRVQVELYGEAVQKGTGLEVSEAYLYLFTISEAVRM